MITSSSYFQKFISKIISVGVFSLLLIQSLSTPHIYTDHLALAQSPAIKTIELNDNLKENNNPKIIAFGHFANNQINDGIVTWIQGGFWELIINNNTNAISNNNDNNNNTHANFRANFTMIKPDGTLSHNHNIENFTSSDVIITNKDIVVIGKADIYSDIKVNNNEYKNVPLTIHLMGNKVLGLTIDVGKTEGHFASPNEMFGTLISGIGLDTSTNNINQTTHNHNNLPNDREKIKESSMEMMKH